ncbi:E3 ubiquitin-protein ligase RNF135 isoform X2 [Lemur catta]|uniref:E3 ubiquitin-protein ligase RNF135 isoform X2 n=1 Tax=Lemur catta TaxID=9447 RepID=UPI001E266D69|nr:E3 ubiquitin-protein ligase RNF135 isoform X2 [Lemur catta]
MAGLAVPVWLAEDDLGCIICQGLLDWPATLPCGHTFCRDCLKDLWGARGARRPWACPTCREGAGQQPQLRKNTLLQELADKYRRAARELGEDPAPGPSRAPAPGPRPPPHPARRQAAVQKSIPEVGQKLTELVEQLVDIVRSLQNQRRYTESGPDNELGILGTWNSQKLRLPPHAHCLTRASLHPREPLGLLHGPSIQPLTCRPSPVAWRCPRIAR